MAKDSAESGYAEAVGAATEQFAYLSSGEVGHHRPFFEANMWMLNSKVKVDPSRTESGLFVSSVNSSDSEERSR